MISIDTNILARYLLGDIPDHSERAVNLIRSAANGDVELFIPAIVVVELAHLLHRRLSIPRRRSADAILDILRIPRLQVENRSAITEALQFWRSNGGLSFPDCYHLALTKELGMDQIYTFDRKMDRYPGVERIEP